MIIQELQSKLQSDNVSGTQNDQEPNTDETDAAAPAESQNKMIIKNKVPNDCSSLSGNGFVQLDVKTNSEEEQQTKKDPLMTIKNNKMTIYCENHWLVIQQRLNGFETDFNRSWVEYAKGFGSIRGDFWIGLELISTLTQNKPHQLLIELTDWSDQLYTAKYESFVIGNEKDDFRLSLSGSYTGNASKDYLDDLYLGFSSQNGAYFSTYDHRKFKSNVSSASSPHDAIYSRLHQKNSAMNQQHQQQQQQLMQKSYLKNCAMKSGGGWWFNNFSNCLPVNLNGIYVTGASAPSMRGIKWQAIRPNDRNYGLKKSKMKIKTVYP